MSAPETLRARTRRAVQSELIAVAQDLFAQRGYETVTVEEIASAAGMSKRSFFRYFAGKDELILGKYDQQGEAFAHALSERPADEPAWIALRRMFDGVVAYVADPDKALRAAQLDRIINSSEILRAGYLERMQQVQARIVEVLRARPGVTLPPLDAAALVAAAFAAMSTAHHHASQAGTHLAEALDAAMDAIATETAPLRPSN